MSTKEQKREQKALNKIETHAQPRLKTLTSFSSARSRTPRFEASASSTTRANSRSIQTTTTTRANLFASSFPLLLFRNRLLEQREAARRRKSSLSSLRFAGKTRRAAGRKTSACLDALYIYIYTQICSSRERCKCCEKVFCRVFFEQLSHHQPLIFKNRLDVFAPNRAMFSKTRIVFASLGASSFTTNFTACCSSPSSWYCGADA